MIFYNIKNELKAYLPTVKDAEQVFPYVAFYNYFQRPAVREGISIKNLALDDEIAYKTLKTVTKIINPDMNIFISRLSYNSFNIMNGSNNENSLFAEIKIDSVPHPGSAWWNMESAKYGTTEQPLTGREKFIKIITS